MDIVSFIKGFMAGVITLLIVIASSLFLHPWIKAFFSGAKIPLARIIGMRLRGNPPKLLIDTYLAMIHAGEEVSMADVESVYIANKSQATNSDILAQLVRESIRKYHNTVSNQEKGINE